MAKRTWLEIDLQRIRDNYLIVKKISGRDVTGVIKADAYGHGAVPVAKALAEVGCTTFAVACLSEAVELRQAGIEGLILILGYTGADGIEDLLKYDITQAVVSEEHAKELAGSKVKVHFALDTGMNRIGLDADDPAECERVIRKYQGPLTVTGLFTHLCVADDDREDAFTYGQMDKFMAVADRVKDMDLEHVHCLNSAAGMWKKGCGDLVRLGITLYGLKPTYYCTLPEGVKPALCWKTVVGLVKTVKAGETIGYGRTYIAETDRRIATLPVGYADGYIREFSNRGFVFINDRKAPVVGRVCMDQMMIDVTDFPDLKAGDEVELLNDLYTADDMGHDVGTISNEIICGFNPRVVRIYKNV